MGLWTGDDSLVRERITAGQVRAYLDEPAPKAARKGREQGPRRGNAACSAVRRPASSTAGAAGRLAAALSDVADPERLVQVGEWIIECETAAGPMARVLDETSAGH